MDRVGEWKEEEHGITSGLPVRETASFRGNDEPRTTTYRADKTGYFDPPLDDGISGKANIIQKGGHLSL